MYGVVMGRLGNFLVGLLLGGALVYTSLKYHIVRAGDGVHLVPKLTAEFSQTYVDVRQFGLQDWTQHQTLAIAITTAGKGDLLQGAAVDGLRGAVGDIFKLPPSGG